MPMVEDDDLELLSRRDVHWTPITGSDMILRWSVFPPDKPASTFPASAYTQKPNPYSLGESDTQIHDKGEMLQVAMQR